VRRSIYCLPLCLLFLSDSSNRELPASTIFPAVADAGKELPSNDDMERLAKNDPIAFLQWCIRRYDREVKGYTATLRKQERIDGEIEPSEIIDVAFREDPFSVRMQWKEGARRASALVYVKGENRDQLLIRPNGIFSVAGVVPRDPYGSDAKKGGRYPVPEFGIKIGMQRTLTSWQKAQKDKTLRVEYLGVKKIKEAGDRPCWVLKRTRYAKPEEDSISQLTIFVDTETWLQVGTILKGDDDKFIGEYFFRDIKLNPEFPRDAFARSAIQR
jgi:hypothetical protein